MCEERLAAYYYASRWGLSFYIALMCRFFNFDYLVVAVAVAVAVAAVVVAAAVATTMIIIILSPSSSFLSLLLSYHYQNYHYHNNFYQYYYYYHYYSNICEHYPRVPITSDLKGHLFLQSGPSARWRHGGRLNKKDGLTRYGNSHVKDKTS